MGDSVKHNTGRWMQMVSSGKWKLAVLAVAAIALAGEGRNPYGPQDKAAYASQATIDFLRPGLVVTVQAASVAADGTISVTYTLADPVGLPLDAAGVYTPGPISIAIVASYIPTNATKYVAYTTRSFTGDAGTFVDPGTDVGGVTTSLGNGQYTYVFKTRAPAGFDATATHTIGIAAQRVMTAFNVPNNNASATFSFVPNGSKVTTIRAVVATASCNNCHDQLSHHGGRRRGVEMCILCHTPQNTDPVTGLSLDLSPMAHRIHMGSSLPSVVAGGTNNVNGEDFSDVVFPADVRRCTACHDARLASQANNYLTKPTAAACGSCHDNVNFATGANHPGGPQFDDKQCANCHIPQGSYDFDASIQGGHVIPMDSSLLGGIKVAMTRITNSAAGQKPTVLFTMKDGAGSPLPTSKVAQLFFTMAGPTTDYGYTSFGSDVTTPGYVQESALAGTTCAIDGSCTYSFTHAVPAGATGTYAIGFEARRTETVLPGTTLEQKINYSPMNQVMYFSADGSAVVNRRTVVQIANCNKCHVELTHHGGRRQNTEYCIMCHNPSQTDNSTPVKQGVNFNMLIHRIHTGQNLAALGKSYTVSGTDLTVYNYSAMDPVGNPGDTRNCNLCHVSNSQQNLPLTKNSVVDPQGYVSPDLPVTAACIGCHADKSSMAHALSNTSSLLGESCDVCHKSTAEFNLGAVHAQY